MSYLLCVVCSIVLSLLASSIIIPMLRKRDLRQTVLVYVTEHESKNGTPTMGGFIFIIGSIATFFAMWHGDTLSLFIVAIALFGALIGFLDDFIKVRYKKNEGLKPYQKVIFQLVGAVACSIFAYSRLGGDMFVPFLNEYVDLGYFSLAINAFAFIAIINTVNLTDGLDGLCVSVSGINVFFFALLTALLYAFFGLKIGENELNSVTVLSLSLVGSLLSYFIVNCFPAYVFMGDVGSLFLGAFLSAMTVSTGLTLFIPIIGIAYVITGLSDILQVVYFKITGGKRIFLMAPLHHHLQKKGLHENRIVAIYALVTIVAAVLVLFSVFGGNDGIFR